MATNSAARALDKAGFDMVDNLRGEGFLLETFEFYVA
jgi:2,4-dienoyl-CoA reductase-like NADH-dependent reductase (Old Yellow Enzyme family)